MNYEASWRCENFPDSCNFEKVSRETIERLETDNDEEIMEGPQVNVEDGKLGNIFSFALTIQLQIIFI